MDLVPVYEEATPSPAPTPGTQPHAILLPAGSGAVIGIQTVAVRREPVRRTLRVAGLIGEDESRHAVISAPVEGRIDGLGMSCEGDVVTRRQPLLTVFSPPLLEAAERYRLAAVHGAEAAEPARHRLEQLGLVWEQIAAIPKRQPDDPHFGLLAPFSGTVMKRYVSEGQYVKAGEKLFELADLSRLWFQFAVPEQDLPLVRVGQVVKVRPLSMPGQILSARLAFISPHVEETTRSAQARVVLENPDRRLRNRTYAEATLEADTASVLAVPRSALLWSGDSPRVFVTAADSRSVYHPRAVRLGRLGDQLAEVLGGLTEGEVVVVSGNVLLDSQAQLEGLATPPLDPAVSPAESTPESSTADDPSQPRSMPTPAAYLRAVARVLQALADDELGAANSALQEVPAPSDPRFPQGTPGPADTLESLRQSVLPWSDAIAAALPGLSQPPAGLRVFRCPMTGRLWAGAPPSARWIQFSAAVRNPFWGAKMPDCGVELLP